MRVADLMTPEPKTVDVTDPIAIATELMEDFHIRHLPVLRDGELVGVISDRDLRSHEMPNQLAMDHLGESLDLLDTPISRVMSLNPKTVGPDDPIGAAIDTMLEFRIGSLLVVDGDDKLVGILSHIDVLQALRPFADQLDD